MHRYGVSEVEKLLQLPRSTIRSLIKAGFVSPARGPRSSWLFSFQDLVVLRQARALVAAKVPSWRVARVMKEMRRQAESGQYALAFEAAPTAPKPIGKKAAQPEPRDEIALERDDPVLFYNLGLLYEALGRKKDAIRHLAQYRRLTRRPK